MAAPKVRDLAKVHERDLASDQNRGFHEAADIFPEMSDEDFSAFKADIQKHGLLTPIVTVPDGRILDGRHRWRVCMELGIEPRYQVHAGNPWSFVISANLHRRHLTTSQKGMVGARVAVRKPGQRGYGTKKAPEYPGAFAEHAPPTQAELGKELGISDSTISTARRVMRSGNQDLVSAVDRGKVTVETAARISTLDPEAQRQFVERIEAGEKPTALAPPSRSHTGGAGRVVIKHPAVNIFTKINAEALGSALFGIETAFKVTTTVDKAVTPLMAKQLSARIRTAKAVLSKVNRLLERRAEGIDDDQ